MSFPAHDWQFWTVTGVFVLAVLWLTRGVLARVILRRKPRPGSRRATLTVSAPRHASGEKPPGEPSE